MSFGLGLCLKNNINLIRNSSSFLQSIDTFKHNLRMTIFEFRSYPTYDYKAPYFDMLIHNKLTNNQLI